MKATKEETLKWARKNSLRLAVGAAAVIAVSLILGISVSSLLVIAGLILIASLSTFYYNYFVAPVNFELVKLSTILVAYSHGIVAGITVGVLSTIIGKVLIGRIDEKLPISAGAIAIIAVLAGLFSNVEIAALGIGLVALYNIAMFAVSMALGGDIGWNLPYEGSNFLINFVLFTRIAPVILPLLQ